MFKTHLLAASAVVALITGLTATLGPAPDDKADALAEKSPISAAVAAFRRHPVDVTGTTAPFVEHDDDPSRRLTTTTSTTTTTAAPTTTTEAAATTEQAPKPKATTTTQAETGGYSSSYESDFASLINGLRSSNGQSALSRDGSLDAEARAWSKAMAADGDISHSNLGRFLPPWSTAGENVGAGGSVTGLFGALADSAGHRANMLGNFTHFGIGVWVDSSGQIWTTHVFAG